MKIAIGADVNAYDLKRIVITHLKDCGHEVVDYGCNVDENVIYPDVAYAVAQDVAALKFERAILICGTGIGMSITANKVVGVRAALAHDVYSAQRARKSNNAQILTMGSQIIGSEVAKTLVDAWMDSEYTPGGRSQPKVERVDEIDAEYQQSKEKAE